MQSVLLLPGLACDAALWAAQRPALAARHDVQVSDVHFRFDTLPEMAAALLAEYPGERVLVGSSMGGMLALEAARQAPQRIKGLALLGSTARPDTPEQIRLRSEAIVLFEQGRVDEVLRANLAFAFHPANLAEGPLLADYLTMIRRAGADALVRQNRAVMARTDQRPHLPALRCPSLVLCGDADLLTPPECSEELARALPQAQLVLLERCGHLLTMEQPRRVTELLLQWLDGLDPGSLA